MLVNAIMIENKRAKRKDFGVYERYERKNLEVNI
jgi:hypothetical protein